MARDLSPKQRRFVNEFVKSRHGTDAAIKAGYAKASADSTATKLQGKARIREAIREQTHSLSLMTAITVERVMREVGVIAFSSLVNYFDFDGDGQPIEKPAKMMDKESIRALKSIKITEKTTRLGKGDDALEETTRTIEYTLWDKPAAIEKLAKHFGMFLELGEVDRIKAELAEMLNKVKAATERMEKKQGASECETTD